MRTGEIRLIKYGVIPSLPYFEITVGRMVGGKENFRVVQIVREPISKLRSEYHIECAKEDEKGVLGPKFIWKTYLDRPSEVQYFAPDEKHNYIKL